MKQCIQCGFPMGGELRCPKCDAAQDGGRERVYEVDVAHSGETWEQAKRKIDVALDHTIYHRYRGLRVIHGYGASSGISVIAPQAIAWMRHLAEQHDARFARDKQNQGVSLIWLNKGRSSNKEDAVYYKSPSSKLPQGNWFDQALEQAKKRP